MKLNKPPVTEEQTILEEYVGFLLTDLSNVHPIKKDSPKDLHDQSQKKISDLVNKKSQPTGEPKLTVAQAEQEKIADSSLSDEATSIERTDSTELTDQKSIVRPPNVEEKPKWSTIEKASIKRKNKPHQSSTLAPAKPAEKKQNLKLEVQRPIDAQADLVEPKKTHHLDAIDQHDFAEEEPEEAQLKKWDALITKEKEDEFLANHSESSSSITDTADTETFDSQVVDKMNASGQVSDDSLETQTQQIIRDYLPQEDDKDPRLASVEKLLSRISLATMAPPTAASEALKKTEGQVEEKSTQQAEQTAEVAKATFLHRETQKSKDILPEVFQTLIFQVGKLPLAVPLLKLGGIIKVSQQDITPLVGSPDWFLGLMASERGNLMVVDTQKYIMPEQLPSEDDEYQYLIVLDNSNWAMACNSVGDAKNLTQDDIRWSEKSSQRPWFAGMVVDYMSALIEVDELINMLADNIVD